MYYYCASSAASCMQLLACWIGFNTHCWQKWGRSQANSCLLVVDRERREGAASEEVTIMAERGAGGKIFSVTMKRAKRVTEKVCLCLLYVWVWVCASRPSQPASVRAYEILRPSCHMGLDRSKVLVLLKILLLGTCINICGVHVQVYSDTHSTLAAACSIKLCITLVGIKWNQSTELLCDVLVLSDLQLELWVVCKHTLVCKVLTQDVRVKPWCL